MRFPTSLDKTGSDAMNAAGDYSAAYCILKTDSNFSGHGMVCPSNYPSTPPFPGTPLIHTSPADLHNRPRKRHRVQSNRQRSRPHQRPYSLLPRRQLGQDMALPSLRLPITLDRTGERRHSPRSRCRRERHLGSLGQDPRQAGMENSGGYDSRAVCGVH